ncbi:MAG: LpxI family protein [bacterium]|nr:LpxI family protein [bacterium]
MINKKLALIAGNGDFPFLFLNEVKSKEENVIVIALKGETDHEIDNCGFPVFWQNIGKLNKIIKIMKDNNVTHAILCGQVIHTKLFTEVHLDLRAIKFLGSLVNKKTDSILGALAAEFLKEGVEMISSVTYMESWMPTDKGVITKTKVIDKVVKDIEFGYDTAKKIAGLDIGQTVVVKDNAVIAVESLEGTDQCILRGFSLAGKGCVVVKVNKPNQDMRFDVPVLGRRTFEILKDVEAAAICFEAGKTLFFDREECLKIAQKNKIVVYAI